MTWSVGELRKERFRFHWVVKESQLGSGKTVMSPAFVENDERSWCLKMERTVSATGLSETINLSVGLLSSPKLPVLVNYEFEFKKRGRQNRSTARQNNVQLFTHFNTHPKPVTLFRNCQHSDHFFSGEMVVWCEIFIFDSKPYYKSKFESKQTSKADFGHF